MRALSARVASIGAVALGSIAISPQTHASEDTELHSVTLEEDIDPNDSYIGQPVFGGSGCPEGTVSVAESFDGTTVSVLFDEYVVETGPGDFFDYTSCSVAVPVHVPQGFTVALVAVDYRGFAAVPQSGLAQLTTEYFFAGTAGPRRTTRFPPGSFGPFLVEDVVQASTLVWSACGADVILRANTSAVAVKSPSTPYGFETFLSVNSADMTGGIAYHLQWKYCNE